MVNNAKTTKKNYTENQVNNVYNTAVNLDISAKNMEIASNAISVMISYGIVL